MMAEDKKYLIPWRTVGSRFALWFLSIPVNLIPTVLKYFVRLDAQSFNGILPFFVDVFADLDITFIQVSVLFVLCIEGYFVDAKIPRTYEKFRSGCFVYFVVAIVLYMAFFFKPELFALMKKQTALCYNLFFLMVTILIGFLCTLVISLEEYESKEKQ